MSKTNTLEKYANEKIRDINYLLDIINDDFLKYATITKEEYFTALSNFELYMEFDHNSFDDLKQINTSVSTSTITVRKFVSELVILAYVQEYYAVRDFLKTALENNAINIIDSLECKSEISMLNTTIKKIEADLPHKKVYELEYLKDKEKIQAIHESKNLCESIRIKYNIPSESITYHLDI